MSKQKPQSPFNGVSFHNPTQKWVPSVLMNVDANGKRKLKNLGYFENDLEAAQVRNKFIEENQLTCKPSKVEGVTPTGSSIEAVKALTTSVAEVEPTTTNIVEDTSTVEQPQEAPRSIFSN